jgi:hypothetical protein
MHKFRMFTEQHTKSNTKWMSITMIITVPLFTSSADGCVQKIRGAKGERRRPAMRVVEAQ